MGLFLLLAFFLPVVALAGLCIAAFHTRILTNASVVIVKTLLRFHGVITDGDGCVVEPCAGGIVLKDVVVPDSLLELATGSVTVQSVSIKRLVLRWPTSSSSFALYVTGVTLRVLQRRTAPKVPANARPVRRNSGKLQALEALLWDGQNHVGLFGGRGRQLMLLQFIVALALRNISVVIADTEFQYQQTGDPCAALRFAEKDAVDVVMMTIRTVDVSPVTTTNSRAQQAFPRAESKASAREQSPQDSDQRTASPPPAVRSLLYRWRNVSVLFPRLQALYNWLDNLIAKFHRVDDCNSSRVTVAGVSVVLMSKSSSAPTRDGSVVSPQVSRQSPIGYRPFGSARLRGRTGVLARATKAAGGGMVAAAPSSPEWDFVALILRQWSMQVDVIVGAQAKGGRDKRSAPRTTQPLAVHIQGTFGMHGQQRCAHESSMPSSTVQQDTAETASRTSRSTAAVGTHASDSLQGIGRGMQRQPSDHGQSSRVEDARPSPRQGQSSASSSGGAVSSARAAQAEGGTSRLPPAGFIIHVDIVLKAFVPELAPAGALQLLRMLDRILTYEKYSKYWTQRPDVSVTHSPAAWWQHAGRAIVNDCREHFPLRKLRDLLARRAEYISAYTEFHSLQRGFKFVTYQPRYELLENYKGVITELNAGGRAGQSISSSTGQAAAGCTSSGVGAAPGPSSGGTGGSPPSNQEGFAVPGATTRRGRTLPTQKVFYARPIPEPSRVAQLNDTLIRLESQLPLGQIFCNRAFVALRHSERLARSPEAKARWLEAMGVITNFVDAIPNVDEEDEEVDHSYASQLNGELGDKLGGVQTDRFHRSSTATKISLGITCPRIGLKLINKDTESPGAACQQGGDVGAASVVTKRSPDVLALMMDNIRFFMPDIYRIYVQAATVKAWVFTTGAGGAKHMLTVPASRECTELYGTKLDFSVADPNASDHNTGVASQKQSTGMARPWACEGAVYPDAPISLYLSRYKVRLAAVEVAASCPPCIVACVRFLTKMVQLKAATQRADPNLSAVGRKWPSANLHALVMDSYTRNLVRVPSSMAVFMPKLQFWCPMVSARWMLSEASTPSIGGITGQVSDALVVAVVTNVRATSRYVHTCYASLVQSMSAHAHVEMYVQLQPRVNGRPAISGGLGSPQWGQFGKIWLHPDDAELAFPFKAMVSLPRDVTHLDDTSFKRYGRTNARGFQGAFAFSGIHTLRGTSTVASEAVKLGQQHCRMVTYPFLPVLKIRSLTALGLNQVPYEPAVPGTTTAHQTVGVHSIMTWFSPWHVKAVCAAVDSLLKHPVVAYWRSIGVMEPAAGEASGNIAVASPATATAHRANDSMPSPGSGSPRNSKDVTNSGGGSSISLLLDVPLLTVNCYAEMPQALSSQDGIERMLQNMQSSGSEMQLPAWVTKRLMVKDQAETDPVLQWGMRLAPLLTLNVTNVRSGVRLTRRNCIMAQLLTTGVQISDHQARLKRQLYVQIWLPNSGQGSPGPAANGVVHNLLPEDDTVQLLRPLATRALAIRDFARDRRRAALCLPCHMESPNEKRGQIRQQWRLLLEVQLLHRASDYAMYLMSTTYRSTERFVAQPHPLESYRRLFQDHQSNTMSSSESTSALESPLEASTQNAPSPFCSSDTHLSGAGTGAAGVKKPRALQKWRSITALSSIAAIFGRGSGSNSGVVPRRKSTSLAQMLGAVVSNRSQLHAAVLRQNTRLLASHNSSPDSGSATLARGGVSMSRSRVAEDSRLARVSAGLVSNNSNSRYTHPVTNYHAAASSGKDLNDGEHSGPLLPGISYPAGRQVPSANMLGASAGKTSSPTASRTPSAAPTWSAFVTAHEESRAAAWDLHGLSARVLSSDFSTSSHGETRLSFVQAFQHLGVRIVQQQRVASVFRMALPTPVINLEITQAPGQCQATALHGSCQHLLLCIGVHSVGALLHMLVQTEQAMTGFTHLSPVAAPRSQHPGSCSKGRGFKATFDLQFLRATVVMEEPPRRVPCQGRSAKPGLTYLTAVELSHLLLTLVPSSVSEGSSGLSMDVAVRDVSVLDLQGCIEHRNVLMAQSMPQGSADPTSDIPQHRNPYSGYGPSESAYSDHGGSRTCRLSVVYTAPSNPGLPAMIRVSVHDPCITWLRRYSNNLLYAIGAIVRAYNTAARQGAAKPFQGGSSGLSELPSEPPQPTTSTSSSDSPVVVLEAFNLQVVLPGGAASRHGPIRRAVHKEALSLAARSVAVCLSAKAVSQSAMDWLDLDDAAVWMTSTTDVDALILSSLRLGSKHFPEVNQQAPVDERLGSQAPHGGNEGRGPSGRQSPSLHAASPSEAPNQRNRLKKHLQAAKATFIDPLTEILKEASTKCAQQHGELGVVLIDEDSAGGPVGELKPGYLSIEDDVAGPSKRAEGVVHTTTTVHVKDWSASVPAVPSVVQGRAPDAMSISSHSGLPGESPMGASIRANDQVRDSTATRFNDVSHEYPPMVLISVDGLAASSGIIVPYDDAAYSRRRLLRSNSSTSLQLKQPQHTQPDHPSRATAEPVIISSVAREWNLPSDLCNVVLGDQYLPGQQRERKADHYDSELESALYLLADTDLQSTQQLIDPVQFKGVVFHHRQHGATQVHLSALGAMEAILGPQQYQRMIKVLTDNVTESCACFDVKAEFQRPTHRPTCSSTGATFRPRPGQLPFFHLTVEWLDQFRAVLENYSAWWKPHMARPSGIEPCLEGCFTQCSLGLMMMQKTNDMFLAFNSQQLHMADVRISTEMSEQHPDDWPLSKPALSAVYAFNRSAAFRTTSTNERSDATRVRQEETAFGQMSYTAVTEGDEEEDAVWTNEHADAASTETPDGQNVQPIVDDQLNHAFPGRSAVVTLLRSNIDLPANEGAHLAGGCTTSGDPIGSGECPHDGQHNCVRVSFAMMNDGTMANEVELCHTVVQWPYLTEMSLVSSIISIFLPGWGHPAAGPEALLRLAATPWFYFNLILTNSQIYLPVLAPHLRRMAYGWREGLVQHSDTGIQLTPDLLLELFLSQADDTAAAGLTASASAASGEGVQPSAAPRQVNSKAMDPCSSAAGNWGTVSVRHLADVAGKPQPERLEHMGVVVSMAALRVGYIAGGDGDSILKFDLRNAAGFVRHSTAQVTNWLLPVRSMILEHSCSVPLVQESQILQKYMFSARVVERRRLRVLRAQSAQTTVPSTDAATHQRAAAGRAPSSEANTLGIANAGTAADDLASVVSRMPRDAKPASAQDLLIEAAASRAAALLKLHKLPLPISSASKQVTMEKLLLRKPSSSTISFELDVAAIRASFSNIPLWHALMDDCSLAMDLMRRNNGIFPPAPLGTESGHVHATHTSAKPLPTSEAAIEMKATWSFRPSKMSVDAKVKSLGLVLCDDKPKSYGAPDVLTAAMEQMAIQYNADRRHYDHLPEQSGCISLRLAAQFLNNSTGRWEHLLEPWPTELQLSDPINPVFKSSRTKYILVSSSELMKLTFHPSALLTFGDTLAFVRRLANRAEEAAATTARSHGAAAVAPVAEDPPSVSEQMALAGSIMMRVPQRYLIQNQTGLTMSYWAPKTDSDVQPVSIKRILPAGSSEELQVTPTTKQVKIVGPGGVVLTRLQAQVIVLNFEGSWMPIPDVSVDVVGKYCYDLHSPTDDRHAPVVVDVALVGRTKILNIHSALYVQNSTSLRLSFRLHFPSAILARQVMQSPGDVRLPGDQDIRLRPLKPGEGRYLPVVAALGGTLYLEARSLGKPAFAYAAAEHDVIRLFPSVNDMLSQAGFIATGPLVEGSRGQHGDSPLHFAVKVRVKTRTEYSYTTSRSMEVPGPGLFSKASRPLEASIKICPTVLFTNSLPYHVEGYLLSLSGAGKETEPAYMGATGTQLLSKPVAASTTEEAVPTKVALPTANPLSPAESRRTMTRGRRSDAQQDRESKDHDRIVSVFERSVLPLLSSKAHQLWDAQNARAKRGTELTANKKCTLLALLRYELRWTAKRNAKETELLIRTDNEAADKITWQELESFLEWAKNNIRAVSVPPGEVHRLYLDMHKQLVLCIKVPERHLVCTRPVVVNASSKTSGNGEAQLPDFMRLDYVGDSSKSFSKVLSEMQSLNSAEPPRPLLKVVNQKLGETAAAVGDKVANTIGKGVRDVLDVFSSQHSPKDGQQLEPVADAAAPATAETLPHRHASLAHYWQCNQDKLVHVELLSMPGPWKGCGGDTETSRVKKRRGAIGGSTDPQQLQEAEGLPGTAAYPLSGVGMPDMGTSIADPLIITEQSVEPGPRHPPPTSTVLADSADITKVQDVPGLLPAEGAPAALHVVKSITGCDEGTPNVLHMQPPISGGDGQVSITPQQHVPPPPAEAPQHAAQPTSASSAGHNPGRRSFFDILKASVVQRFHDSLKGKASLGSGQRRMTAMGPPVEPEARNGHVRVRLSYRPELVPIQATEGSSPQQTMVGIAPPCGISDGSRGIPPKSDNGVTATFCAVAVRFHVVSATPSTPEHVRLQLLISPARPDIQQVGPWISVSTAWHGSYGTDAAREACDAQACTTDDQPGISATRSEIAGCQASNPNCQTINSAMQRGESGGLAASAWSGFAPHPAPLQASQESSPGELHESHSTPRAMAASGASLFSSRYPPASPTTDTISEATPESALVLRTSVPVSPASAPREYPSSAGVVQSRSPHRPDAVWSENAAYKCGSSVSTTSGSDLPVRLLPHDLQQGIDVSKSSVGGSRPSIPSIPSVGGSTRGHLAETPFRTAGPCHPFGMTGSGQQVGQAIGASSGDAVQLDNGAPATGHISALCSAPSPTLSEGYAQLELFHEHAGSTSRHANSKYGRRSATLSGSTSLRRAPSKSSHSAGSAGRSSSIHVDVFSSRASAGLVGPCSPEVAAGIPQDMPHTGSTVSPDGMQLFAMRESRRRATASQDGVAACGSGVKGDEDLPVIKEATASSSAISTGTAAVQVVVGAPVVSHHRRWTADDVDGKPHPEDNPLGLEGLGLSFLGTSTAAGLPEQIKRKSVSDKHMGERMHGWRYRYSHERDASRRVLLQSSLGRGIGKKGPMQPSYKALLLRQGRSASNPITLARHAIQVVPDLARNMGEKFVDGGQQVIQGVPLVASKVADTIIAGGHGVKDKVVESTEQAIALAKPKIKEGLMAIAWKATEAMRKRKQGAEDFLMFEDQKSARSKRRREVERTPRVLLLSLYNSLSTKEDEYVCRLSLYAPYWVDNRTGFHLLFKDLDAPAGIDNLRFLLWHPVQVPGIRADAFCCEERTSDSPSHANLSGMTRLDKPSSGLVHGSARRGSLTPAWPKPALLNDQARTRFRVLSGNECDRWQYSATDFCLPFTIATTNQKYSVDIKGVKGEVNIFKIAPVNSSKLTPTSSRRSSVFDGRLKSSQCMRKSMGEDVLSKGAAQPADMAPDRQSNDPVDLMSRSSKPVTGHQSPSAFPDEGVDGGYLAKQPEGALMQGSLRAAPVQAQVQSSRSRLCEEQGTTDADVSLATCAAQVLGVAIDQPSTSRKLTASDAVDTPSGSALLVGLPEAHEEPPQVPPVVQNKWAPRRALETVTEITPVEDDHGNDDGQPKAGVVTGLSMPAGAAQGVKGNPSLEGYPGQSSGLSMVQSKSTRLGHDGTKCLGNATPAVALTLDANTSGVGSHAHRPKAVPASVGLEAPTCSGADTQQAITEAAAAGAQLPLVTSSSGASKKGYSSLPHKGSSGKRLGLGGHESPKELVSKVYVRRQYQFAVEVWAAPSDTVFARTKVVTVKNKYMILNATGLAIDCKQKGTPDPEPIPVNNCGYGKGLRFSRRLENNARAAWHWDNADAEQELRIRPAGDDWEWSGSFKLPEMEDYFGLRIRHRRSTEYVIIPVNISVGPAGSVLITLKSKGSVPPYMIINRCRDVVIRLKQADYSRQTIHSAGDEWRDWDEIQPGSNQIPFAWDEPRLRHVVKVVATSQRGPGPDPGSAIDVDLDAVDANRTIYVQSLSTRSWALAAQLDGRERAKFLTDNAKKVYVTVYADGPTRVLCFSEDRSGAAYLDDENSLLNLSYRLQRVAMRLKEVDQRLMQQLGTSWDSDLGARQGAEIAATDSLVTGASGGAPELRLHDRPREARSVPRHVGNNLNASGHGGRLQLSGANSTGAGTPLQGSRLAAGSGQALQVSPSSFAFQRFPSLGKRNASTYTFTVTGPNRNPSLPSTTTAFINNSTQRLQQSRNPSSQSHVSAPAKAAFAVDAFPPLFVSAPYTEDSVAQGLDVLPAFGGDVDLPVGGDLTVILRYVEGLSAGLNNNEKLVAVEAKMTVVSSTPHIDDSPDDEVTATWTQVVDSMSAAGSSAVIDSNNTGVSGVGGVTTLGYTGRLHMQDHAEIFRDVAASSELQIEFFIAKGTEQPQAGHAGVRPTRPKRQLTAAASSRSQQGPSNSARAEISSRGTTNPRAPSSNQRLAVSTGQFAGCVRVPLVFTLGRDKSQTWRLPLERKAGSQLIRGYVALSFEWSMTSEGMLVREVATLERILEGKVELLAQLNPLTPSASAVFVCGHAVETNAIASPSTAAAAESVSDAASLNLGAGGATGSIRSSPIKKTAKALAESYNVNLELSVVEISGLLPREGLRASLAASVYGRQTANLVSVAMLPHAVVSMTVGGETTIVSAGNNSVNPRFAKNTSIFKNVALGGKVVVKVLDQVGSSYRKVLADGDIELSSIPGTDPIYAWLSLARCKRGSRSQRALALIMVMEEEGDAGVQLLMRIKINKPQVHGVSMNITLDLAGIGLCAKTSLEELFNYTMQKIRASMVQTRTDLRASLVIQTIQLDNQMLEAKNPVVLSPADVSGSSSLAQARRRHKARIAQRFGSLNPILRLGGQDPSQQDPLLTFQVVYNQASSNHPVVDAKGQVDSIGILAFKKVVLELGPLDFSADQEFIEGVIAYLNGLPLEDFRQDRAWQHKIDAMQVGSMAPAEELTIIERRDKSKFDQLVWIKMKQAKELELLRGQSSMWFYLEEFYLSDIYINVTLALSSSFNASGSSFSSSNVLGRDEDRQRSMLGGLLSRVSGSNGFQLINVTNAPILLEYVELQNHLVNRVSLINKLYRHYSWIALAQARKVLGGAGPAIAAIPASLLWASLAMVDLGQDVAAKRVNPLVVPTRIGYVMFTLMGQIIGVMSRTMCAVMSILPPRFSVDSANLSDSETAQRFDIKPQTVMDALYLCQRDVVLGLASAGFGVVHDITAGLRWKGGLVALGVPMGIIKASVGLGIRPAAGGVEATSKLLQGLGLMCLGKRGIQGKLVRRVQAPGMVINDVVQAARASAVQAAMQATLIAAWQAALPAISATLADDEVVDVVAARSTRVVLLTNRHLAYLYARRQTNAASSPSPSTSGNAPSGAFTVTYKVKWIIRNDHIDNIRGLERGYAVSVEYHKPVKLGRLSLKLPLHKGMRTASAEGHKELIFRLNRHIGRTAIEVFAAPIAAVAGGDAGDTGADLQELRMMQPSDAGTNVQGGPGAQLSAQ